MPDPRASLVSGLHAERAGDLERALVAYVEAAESHDSDIRAEALTRLADVHRERCEWDDASASARKAQEVAREAGLERRLMEAVVAEANIDVSRGDFARAMPRFQEIANTSSDARLRGIAQQNIGSMLAQLGRHDAAETAMRESLQNFQEAGYARGEVMTLNNLGRLELDRKRPEAAQPLLVQAVQAAASVGESEMLAISRQNLAMALGALGTPKEAEELVAEALGYFTTCGNHWRALECLRMLGEIHEQQGQKAEARRCYERALALAEQIESAVEIRVTRHKLHGLAKR